MCVIFFFIFDNNAQRCVLPVSFPVDLLLFRAVDSRGARAPPEFEGSEKGRSLISAYRSLAITTNTPWVVANILLLDQSLLWDYNFSYFCWKL